MIALCALVELNSELAKVTAQEKQQYQDLQLSRLQDTS